MEIDVRPRSGNVVLPEAPATILRYGLYGTRIKSASTVSASFSHGARRRKGGAAVLEVEERAQLRIGNWNCA
jgi:hypothetical protein